MEEEKRAPGPVREAEAVPSPASEPTLASGERATRPTEIARTKPDAQALGSGVYTTDVGQLGPYRLNRRLGEGGFGAVWDAEDTASGERVAVKTLHAFRPAALLRLKREFRYARGVVHPNLVGLYELGAEDGAYYVAMELVEDATPFDRWVSPVPGRPNAARLVAAYRELVDAVTALHREGVLHLDLKPENVLVDGAGRVVVLDFGLAALRNDRLDGSPEIGSGSGRGIVGTPAFMAPEQARGELATAAADRYALGAVLYLALAGRVPFEGSPFQMLTQKRLGPAPPIDREAIVAEGGDALGPLVDLAMALLERDPSKRPGEAELRERLGLTPRKPGKLRKLVGREDELAALEVAWREHLAGSPVVIEVSAPSGIGKSALLRAFAELRASAQDALVLVSRCHELEHIPHKAIDGLVDGLHDALQSLAEPERRAYLADAAEAAMMFPVLGGILHGGGPSWEKSPGGDELQRARAGLRAVFERIARLRPLALVVDDAQWGDADSARRLLDLFAGAAPPFVILSLRPEEAVGSPFLAELREGLARLRVPRRSLALAPLDDHSAQRLLERLAPTLVAEPERLAAIVRECGGNPFFLEQVAALRAEGGEGVVPTVDAAVLRRFDGLPAEAKRFLELTCLAASPLPQRTILEAAETVDARGAVARVRAASLVRLGGGTLEASVEPYHDRVREAVVAALDDETRTRGHGALADALLAEPRPEAPPAALLAHHLHHAARDPEAVTWAVEAARNAERAFAFARAAQHYEDVLAWTSEGHASQAGARLGRARNLHRAGLGREAGEAYLEAAETGEGDAMELRRRGVGALLEVGELSEAEPHLRALLRQEGIPFPKNAGRALADLAWVAGRLHARTARGLPKPRARREASERRADLAFSVGKTLTNLAPVEGASLMTRSLLYALEAGDAERVGRGLAFAGTGFTPLVALRANRFLALAEELAAREGSVYLEAAVALCHSLRGFLDGRWRDAMEAAEKVLALAPETAEPMSWEIGIAHLMTVSAREYHGNYPLMSAEGVRWATEARERGDWGTYVQLWSNQGFARAAGKDLRGLRSLIADQREVLERWNLEYGLWDFYTHRLEVLYALRRGEVAKARELVDAEWPRVKAARLHWLPLTRGPAHQVRAAVALASGDAEDARRSLKRLAGCRRADGPAFASMVDAALREGAGDVPGALRAFGEAEERYRAADMAVGWRMAAWRAARLREDAARAAMLERELEAQGVVDVASWALYQAPSLAVSG
ncbi:MAG: AAA family ATPase [Myxococcota bacterium]